MAGQPHEAIPHDYNGEWAEADFGQARPASDAIPPAVVEPARSLVAVRLSRDVVEPFRSAGPGWEARIETVLRQAVEAGTAGSAGSEQHHEFVSDGCEG